jgi:predicted RNA methylase
MDWYAWHEDYDNPGSSLAQRLAGLQEQLRVALDGYPPGRITVLSMCAGQGRDLLPVLAAHPRRDDVVARLVELDPRNVEVARRTAADAGLSAVEVVEGDAARTDHYAGLAPADLVMVCGVFGNISEADIEATVRACTALCRQGGTVVWTRHRKPPDLIPRICAWFADNGFELVWLSGPDAPFGLGVHRFTGVPRPLDAGTRLFTFLPRGD